MQHRFTIVGLGEALFDTYSDRQVLGGAPLNVAVHAHQLAQPLGGRGLVVSRVGQDDAGKALIEQLRARGMDTGYVQTDPDLETGRVYITQGWGEDQPSYEIVENVAFDNLQYDPDVDHLAGGVEAVCFGTLAQRDSRSRNTIYRFLERARRAVRMFDVNLRKKYFDHRTLRRSAQLATIVKLNEDELPTVCRAVGTAQPKDGSADARVAAAVEMGKSLGLQAVVLTRGKRGTLLLSPQGRFEGEPAEYTPEEGADTVGAGDATSAALLVGLAMRWSPKRCVDLANEVGAYVASVPGATPELPAQLLKQIKSGT